MTSQKGKSTAIDTVRSVGALHVRAKIKKLFRTYALIPLGIAFILFLIIFFVYVNIRPRQYAVSIGQDIVKTLSPIFDAYISKGEEYRNKLNFVSLKKKEIAAEPIFEDFYNFNNQQDIRSLFHILDENGEIVLTTSSQRDDNLELILQKEIIPYVISNRKYFSQAHLQSHPFNKNTVYTIAFADNYDHPTGYIIFQLYEEDFQKIIFTPHVELTAIVDDYDQIIASTNNIVKGLMNKFDLRPIPDSPFVRVNNENYYMAETAIPEYKVFVLTLNSVEGINILLLILIVFFTFLMFLIYILMNYLADKMAFKNTESLDQLIQSVKALTPDNSDLYIDVKTGDEFEFLADEYNTLLAQLNKTVRRNEELANLRHVQELKELQAQFNPHFLFNTLEMIRYSALIDQDMTQDIIMALSRILKYSLRQKTEFVVLADDLSYIEDYLKINKMRFQGRFDYHISVSNETKDLLIPKLILQPIIENSIKHSFKDKSDLKIQIYANIEFSSLSLKIVDNGSGIAAEKLDKINELLQQSSNLTTHIGLYNVNRRLKLLYGDEYGLTIESIKGEFTQIKIILPIVRGDGNDQKSNRG